MPRGFAYVAVEWGDEQLALAGGAGGGGGKGGSRRLVGADCTGLLLALDGARGDEPTARGDDGADDDEDDAAEEGGGGRGGARGSGGMRGGRGAGERADLFCLEVVADLLGLDPLWSRPQGQHARYAAGDELAAKKIVQDFAPYDWTQYYPTNGSDQIDS